MNTLRTWKRQIEEIESNRYTVVEKNISESRKNFLKGLLEFNKFEVLSVENQDASFSILVKDVFFNPIIAVYERSLRYNENEFVSPAIWNQEATKYSSRYWVKKNNPIN